MKSKTQKIKEVKEGEEFLNNSKSVILMNFSKIPVNDVRDLKKRLKEIKGKMKVMKKTLFSIIFKNKNINIDATQYKGQLAAIFGEDEIINLAGTIYKFSDEHKNDGHELNMILGYDLVEDNLYDAEKMLEFGKLPARDVLLAQLVGMLSAPIRAFAIVIKQIAVQKEKIVSSGSKNVDDEDKIEKREDIKSEEDENKRGDKLSEEKSNEKKSDGKESDNKKDEVKNLENNGHEKESVTNKE